MNTYGTPSRDISLDELLLDRDRLISSNFQAKTET